MATLYDLAMQYLKQGLPDISGIYPATTTPPPVTTDPVDGGDVKPFPVASQPNGGDGFNPYNIRPGDSSIRTPDQYSPYAYNRAMRDTGTFSGDTVMPNPDLYYAPPTGIQQLMNKIPTPFGFIRKGLDALADKLPVNRRGILENELLGGGIMLDDIGRIVTNNYNTPEGIMAGYNAAKLSPESFDKRTSNIRNTLKEKYNLSDAQIDDVVSEIEETGEYKGDLGFNPNMGTTTNLFSNLVNINKAKNIFNQKQKATDIIFNRKLEERQDPITIANRKSAIDQEASNRDAVREAAKKSAARKSAVAQETSNRDYARNAGRDRARDSAQSSATGRGATSATSSGLGGLGFSDIRLKENIELIGKSPSNINIYKFNYKDNPTTYQGAMAHEVSWASFKHPSGYMMVDYNKIDVEFKKI